MARTDNGDHRHSTRARGLVDAMRGKRSYTDLSSAMGRSPRTVSDMLSGRNPSVPNRTPDIDLINDLAAVLPVPAGLLMRLFALDRGLNDDYTDLADRFDPVEVALLDQLAEADPKTRRRAFDLIQLTLRPI
jgi:transcriptional regulator with XRE-family HTH domain